jgi:hypothetical protein
MSLNVRKLDNRRISKLDANYLLEQIADIKYGSVTIKIQDGIAIQIDKNEKIRVR